MKFRVMSSVKGAAWQFLPAAGTLLISLLVIRKFGDEVWGVFVPVLVTQQVLNTLLAWGNKEFLQRVRSQHAYELDRVFARLFLERSALLLPVVCLLLWMDPFSLGVALAIMVAGQFLKQSLEIHVLNERKFMPAGAAEALVIVAQLLAIAQLEVHWFVWIVAVGPMMKALLQLPLFFHRFSRVDPRVQFTRSLGFLWFSGAGFLSTKADLLVISAAMLSSPAELAAYQVVMSMIWMVQAAAAFLVNPFVPHLIRLNEASAHRFRIRLLITGLIASSIGVMVCAVLALGVFQFEIAPATWLPAWLLAMSSFVLTPMIFQFYRMKMESTVALHIAINAVMLALGLWLAHLFVGLDLLLAFWLVCAFKMALIGSLSIHLQRAKHKSH